MSIHDGSDEELLARLRGPLTAMRDSLGSVRMQRPAEAVIAAGRARRRWNVLRASVAGAAAVCAAVTAVWAAGGLAGPASRGGGAQAVTVASVIGQVRTALVNSNMVLVTSYTFYPKFPEVTQWSYEGRYRVTQQSRAAGTTPAGYAVVDYSSREWRPASRPQATLNRCAAPLDIVESDGPVDWPSYLRQALACGEFQYAGRGELRGSQAIELTGSMRGPAQWAEGPRPAYAAPRVSATLYVDPVTYIPLRMVWHNSGQDATGRPIRGTISEDVRQLPPTRANIAKATLRIPASFRRAPAASLTGPVFQYLS